jgi:hypothetical protein
MKKVSSEETIFLLKASKNLDTLLEAVTHLAEGLCLSSLLALKIQNTVICSVGTRTPEVTLVELQFALAVISTK